MTTSDSTLPEPVAEPGVPVAAESASWQLPVQPQARPAEMVSRGLIFSLGAIPVGMAVAVVIWKMGFIASISSFLIAAGAVFLYTKGAGTPPRQGLLPLLVVVVLGVAASFFAIVAADLITFFGTPEGQALGYPSEATFVRENLFNGALLKSYGSDLGMFVLFAALGVFGTIRRLLATRPA